MKEKLARPHEVSMDVHGIVNIKIAEGAHIGVEALQQINRKTQELSGKKKVLALIDAHNFHTLAPEATHYLRAEVVDKTRIATAVVSKKLALHIMIDNMSKVQKTKSPIRMFSSEARARA